MQLLPMLLARSAMSRSSEAGQSTVEAAFMLPVLFLLMILLMQPTILLYDRMVMESAAAEGCRLLMTYSGSSNSIALGGYGSISGNADPVNDYVRRRLGMIPQTDIFHIHDGGCSYRITTSGDETSDRVSVTIENDVKLLPLLGQAASGLGLARGGVYHQTVSVEMPGKPAWATGDPESWDEVWD